MGYLILFDTRVCHYTESFKYHNPFIYPTENNYNGIGLLVGYNNGFDKLRINISFNTIRLNRKSLSNITNLVVGGLVGKNSPRY